MSKSLIIYVFDVTRCQFGMVLLYNITNVEATQDRGEGQQHLFQTVGCQSQRHQHIEV